METSNLAARTALLTSLDSNEVARNALINVSA
jgi:hypothetical protein